MKNGKKNKKRYNKIMKKTLLCLLLLLLCAAVQAGVRGRLRQGGKYYNEQKYGSALNSYHEILKEDPGQQDALFNAANAYYRLNEYTQAQEAFREVADRKGARAQDALFNLGNAYYRAGDKDKAIEAYKAAVLSDPQDKEAIHNLQLVIEQKQQNNKNQNNNDNQDNRSDNRQNQQKNGGNSAGGQKPQEGQMDKNDAQRVLSVAKENEYKRPAGRNRAPEEIVDKDW